MCLTCIQTYLRVILSCFPMARKWKWAPWPWRWQNFPNWPWISNSGVFLYKENKPLLHLSHCICAGHPWVLPHSPTNLWVFLLHLPQIFHLQFLMCVLINLEPIKPTGWSLPSPQTHSAAVALPLKYKKRETQISRFVKKTTQLITILATRINRRKGASLNSCSFTLLFLTVKVPFTCISSQ